MITNHGDYGGYSESGEIEIVPVSPVHTPFHTPHTFHTHPHRPLCCAMLTHSSFHIIFLRYVICILTFTFSSPPPRLRFILFLFFKVSAEADGRGTGRLHRRHGVAQYLAGRSFRDRGALYGDGQVHQRPEGDARTTGRE